MKCTEYPGRQVDLRTRFGSKSSLRCSLLYPRHFRFIGGSQRLGGRRNIEPLHDLSQLLKTGGFNCLVIYSL